MAEAEATYCDTCKVFIKGEAPHWYTCPRCNATLQSCELKTAYHWPRIVYLFIAIGLIGIGLLWFNFVKSEGSLLEAIITILAITGALMLVGHLAIGAFKGGVGWAVYTAVPKDPPAWYQPPAFLPAFLSEFLFGLAWLAGTVVVAIVLYFAGMLR